MLYASHLLESCPRHDFMVITEESIKAETWKHLFQVMLSSHFPGGPVVKTQLLLQGMQVQYVVRNKILHAAWHGQKIICFLCGSDSKESDSNAGDLGSIPGSGRSPGEGNGNPLQYSCLENLMEGRAWWATVHGVAKSQTRLRDFTFAFCHK